MSEFSSYEKMPTSLQKLRLSENDYARLDKLKWVVTEKIHGANFSLIYQNKTLKFAKRKEYLTWKSDFFGFQQVVATIETQVIQLFEQLSRNVEADKYIIYGELFGGAYPHPEVNKIANVQAIQTGVYYSPNIHFSAFDIAYQEGGKRHYLDYETSINYFRDYSLFYCQPLLVGSLNQASNFNIRIHSTLPKELGLPLLTNNLIEGVVIKPYNQPLDIAMETRPIFKYKNPEFEEQEKFHKANKWSFVPNVSSRSEDLSFIVEDLRTYINNSRMASAISKIGALNKDVERLEEIKQEVLQDAMIDFNENNSDILQDLAPDEINWIKERITVEITNLMQKR